MIFFRGSTGGAVKIVKNTTYCSASDPMSDLSSNVSCFLDFIPVAMLPGSPCCRGRHAAGVAMLMGPPCRWGRHPNAVVMRMAGASGRRPAGSLFHSEARVRRSASLSPACAASRSVPSSRHSALPTTRVRAGQPTKTKGTVSCHDNGTGSASSMAAPPAPVAIKTRATIQASASGLSLRQ